MLGHAPHASFSFGLNRLAVLVGGNADATAATFQNIQITSNVLEPAAFGVGVAAAVGLAMQRHRRTV